MGPVCKDINTFLCEESNLTFTPDARCLKFFLRRRTCSNYYLQIGSEYQPPKKQQGKRTLKNGVLTWEQLRCSKVAVKGSRPILVGKGNNQTS